LNTDFLTKANEDYETLLCYRRQLHRYAEVGFDLKKTKEYVKNVLLFTGITPKDCGKAGVIGIIGGKKAGKTVLLRADMDALPIREESGLPFAAENGGMHACGHDLHTAMLLGAAKLLKEAENTLNGTVKLMFQPAEELLAGAQDMIKAGVLENPPVDAAMMIHVLPASEYPAKTVRIAPAGISAPAADFFTVEVFGKGCHGSSPQNGVDPILIAAKMLTALETIHTRELAPGTPSVLTIGSVHGGDAANVIPEKVVLKGTIRSLDTTVHAFTKKRLCEICQETAAVFCAEAAVTFDYGCPPLDNEKQLVLKAKQYMKELLGEDGVVGSAGVLSNPASVIGGSEDFSYLSERVPSVMLSLSAGSIMEGYQYPLHHPKVLFDESILPVGAAVYAQFAYRYLLES